MGGFIYLFILVQNFKLVRLYHLAIIAVYTLSTPIQANYALEKV